MKNIYEKAMELYNDNLDLGQKRIFFNEFEFVSVHLDMGGDIGVQGCNPYVKIMKKDIGFTFKITHSDPEDLNRMQFVYDVTIAAKNNDILLPLAKKVMPDFRKIDKKFPGKISQKEYSLLNIHDKNAVISLISKILN